MDNKKEDYDKILFTSDWHFMHKNVLKYDNRPFKDLDEMHETIVRKWNEVVDEDCTVYNLGDLSFGKKDATMDILYQLKGKIHIIRGNHDKGIEVYKHRFESINDYLVLRKLGLVLFHYPIATWEGMHRGSIHLHGHSHGSLKPSYNDKGIMYTSKRLDVGCNLHDYYPITLNQVHEKMDSIKLFSPDNHNEETK